MGAAGICWLCFSGLCLTFFNGMMGGHDVIFSWGAVLQSKLPVRNCIVGVEYSNGYLGEIQKKVVSLHLKNTSQITLKSQMKYL